MHATKIAIIGTGAVGATTAFACMMRNITSELLLVDIKEAGCRGELLDLSDSLSFCRTAQIKQATYKEAAQADIIIIAAGARQREGQTRDQLLETNQQVIKAIIEELGDINPQAIVIIVTNPVDILTWYAQQLIDLPTSQIFGSGTLLDSQRLRNLIAQRVHVAEQSIHAYIIGQHGDHQVAALSAGSIAGTPLTDFLDIKSLRALADEAKQKVYEIISCKGWTCYGVASCVAAVCEDILFDQNRIVPVSCYIDDYKVTISMPAVIGASGIKQIIPPALNSDEQSALEASVKIVQKNLAKLKTTP